MEYGHEDYDDVKEESDTTRTVTTMIVQVCVNYVIYITQMHYLVIKFCSIPLQERKERGNTIIM